MNAANEPKIDIELSNIGSNKEYILITYFDRYPRLLAKVSIENDKVNKKAKMGQVFQTGPRFEELKSRCRTELINWWSSFQKAYTSHCYKCQHIITNEMEQCQICKWYKCVKCGSCGCEFRGELHICADY